MGSLQYQQHLLQTGLLPAVLWFVTVTLTLGHVFLTVTLSQRRSETTATLEVCNMRRIVRLSSTFERKGNRIPSVQQSAFAGMRRLLNSIQDEHLPSPRKYSLAAANENWETHTPSAASLTTSHWKRKSPAGPVPETQNGAGWHRFISE